MRQIGSPPNPPAICPTCGEGIYPTFFSGENYSAVEYSCNTCEQKRMDKQKQRLYRVWELSGLSDEEGTKLIEPVGAGYSIQGWFEESTRIGVPIYTIADVMIDSDLYGHAIAKLIAVGRKRRTPAEPATTVVAFRRRDSPMTTDTPDRTEG